MGMTTYRLLEPGDEVVPVLLLLQTGERHLSTRDVLGEVLATAIVHDQ